MPKNFIMCLSTLILLGLNAIYRSTQSPKMDIIHHSSNVQDLGITKSSDCTFNARINSLSKRCKNFTGWILRTFISRDKLTVLTLFKHLYYQGYIMDPSYGLLTKFVKLTRLKKFNVLSPNTLLGCMIYLY